MNTYIVNKSLNNNVLIANNDQNGEVVLIGKGIGFNHKKDDSISEDSMEKLFLLRNEKDQEHYKELLPHIDEEIWQTIISSTDRKRTRLNSSHVAIAYAF